MHEFLLDELLDGAAAVASKHGGGCSNEHAPASMYSLFLFFYSLSVTDEIPAVVARGYHCRFPSARSMSGSNRPFGTGSVSHFWSSVKYHCRFVTQIGSDCSSITAGL
jgi:hypothetical protein